MNKTEEMDGYNILVVDDEIEYQEVLKIILEDGGYSVLTASSGIEALRIISENEIDLVLTDLKMDGMDGIELIGEIKKISQDIDIIVVTAYGTIKSAVEAIKYGANGYFVKSENPKTLLIDIERLSKIKKLTAENKILKSKVNGEYFLETLNGEFKKILTTCKKAALSNINILILGESGVGKEVIANYIHALSERKDKQFVPVNCQAFSEGTLESELFGHEKGAFTGAINKRIGRFEEANFGTIFLDEIGDIPLPIQSKILRTLDNKSIERVGSNRPIKLDIRIISATNKDLDEMISNGEFREDLMYRINTLVIKIPPLRDRREDIPILIEYFLKRIQKEQKKVIRKISPSTQKYLLEYDYPGNVRELKNILERLVVLSEDGVLRNIFERVSEEEDHEIIEILGLKNARRKFEEDYIKKALQVNDWNVTKTAESLKITVRQLWNKISEYDIKIKR